MGPVAPTGFNWAGVRGVRRELPADAEKEQVLMQSGKTLACIVCDEKYKGLQHNECTNKHCKCPQHIAEALEGIKNGVLLDDWGRDVQVGPGFDDSGSMMQHALGHHISDQCAGFSHSICGDNNCQCSCHDATDSRSRWQCPRCKFWVYEKMAKHCELCQTKAVSEINQSPTMDEMELAWAKSLNPYPHKGRPKLIVLDDEADRKQRRELAKKGIIKATDI